MELEIYKKVNNPIDAIEKLGEWFGKSGMFGCDRVEQGRVLAMTCLTEQMSPAQLLEKYDLVDGKLKKKAMAALAEFRSRGGKFRWLDTGERDSKPKSEDEWKAVLELTDQDGNQIVYSYSLARARDEGLIRKGSRWEKGAGNMLRARCASNGVAMLMPEIYAGSLTERQERLQVVAEWAPTNQTSPPAKSLLSSPAAVPTDAQEVNKAPEPPSKEEEIVVDADIAEEPVPEPQPEQEEAPTTPPEPSSKAPAPPGRGINASMMKQLAEVMGDDEQASFGYLTHREWITDNNLATLSKARAQLILKKPDVWRQRRDEWKKEGQ